MLHRLALRVFAVLPRPARRVIIRVLHPTFTAGTAVIVTDPLGRVLLVTHSYSPGWGLPGGLMNRGEEPAATAQREVREELGLDVSFHGTGAAVKTPGRYHFNVLFRAGIDDDQAAAVTPGSPEITGHGFFALDELPELAEFTDLFLAHMGLRPGGPE